MSDLRASVGKLAHKIGGVKAAILVEANGIEVAAWGEADFDTVSAELAELWMQVNATDMRSTAGQMMGLQIKGSNGGWVAVPLGEEYVLAVLVDAGVPLGKAMFYASEWVAENLEEFS